MEARLAGFSKIAEGMTLDGTMAQILKNTPNLPESEVERLAKFLLSDVDQAEIPAENWVRRKSFAELQEDARRLRETSTNPIDKTGN